MQSGISVSQELRAAFDDFTSSGTQFAIIARIQGEHIVTRNVLPSRSAAFLSNVEQLGSALEADEAAYILLRRYDEVPDGFVAVTYVPDSAPVRQKMLFASTRLALIRELGPERFRETLFATTREELTADGWRKHDQHGTLKAPLTTEEQTLQGVREAEAETSQGTATRRSHVSSGLNLDVSEGAMEALRRARDTFSNLVQLRIDTSRESVELVSSTVTEATELATQLSDSEPRFAFYTRGNGSAVFIYTCPEASIKERMLYASSKTGIIEQAREIAGLTVTSKLEASRPSEIEMPSVEDQAPDKVGGVVGKAAFARPKRPGRSGMAVALLP